MKSCEYCGFSCKEQAQFCPKCGKTFSSSEEPVSVKRWALYQSVSLFPIVGPFATLVMLFVWAFGKGEENQTFRNWARARLVVIAIGLALSLLVLHLFFEWVYDHAGLLYGIKEMIEEILENKK